MILETVLVVVIAAMIVGTGWYVYNSKKNSDNAYSTADKASSGYATTKTNDIKKAATANTVPTTTEKKTPTPSSATPTAPKSPTKTATISHPTRANCTGKDFTVYVSNPSGTHTYQSASTSSTVKSSLAYKASFAIVCDSYSPDGWGVYNDYWIPLKDLSLKPV